MSLHSYFQVSPETFDLVQVRAQAGPLKDIESFPEATHALSWLVYLLSVFVHLEGEPSPPVWGPERSRAGFHQGSLSTFLHSSYPRPWLVSQSHSMMLHHRDGGRFPSDVTLGIQAKEFHLGFIRPENLVSHDLSPLVAFWQTPSGLSCAFYWGVASVWPLYHKGLISRVLHRWLSFWKVLPSPKRNSGAHSEWPSGSLSPPWLRPSSPECSVLPAGQV